MPTLRYIATAIGIVITLLFPLPLLSQSQGDDDLDNVVSERLSMRTKEKVDLFLEYLRGVSDRSVNVRQRQYYKEMSLKLFIGEGNDYKEEIVNSDGSIIDTIIHKAVTIGFTSLRNPNIRKKPLALFLENLKNNLYKPVSIQKVNLYNFRISEPLKVDEGKYVCTIYLEEGYIMIGQDWKIKTTNKTTKRIVCNLDFINEGDGIEFIV